MIDRPILFKDEMVRAILSGEKTQTRRPVKFPLKIKGCYVSDGDFDRWKIDDGNTAGMLGVVRLCPYGRAGDSLWVREAFSEVEDDFGNMVIYRADYPVKVETEGGEVEVIQADCFKWSSPIYMFREYSRIDLKITEVRLERLWSISDADAAAEGVLLEAAPWLVADKGTEARGQQARAAFSEIWQKIHPAGIHSWAENPWVWVISFQRSKP